MQNATWKEVVATHLAPVVDGKKEEVKEYTKIDCSISAAVYHSHYLVENSKLNVDYAEVFKELFTGTYLYNQRNAIGKALDEIMGEKPELARQEFISKLVARIPMMDCVKNKAEHKAKLLMLTVSAQIINILEDNGVLEITHETVTYLSGDRRCTKTVTTVHTDGVLDPKYLLRGLHLEPGQLIQKKIKGFKFPGKLKTYMRKAASMPFVKSGFMTEELIQRGYELSHDYNTVEPDNYQGRAAVTARKDRYSKMLELIMALGKLDQFYLSIKFDGRLRTYYDFGGLLGMRPQGKLHEVCTFDSAVFTKRTARGADHLKHIIMVERYERMTLEDAVSKFTDEDLEWALCLDPLDEALVYQTKEELEKEGVKSNEKEFGRRVMLNKAAIALNRYFAGQECNYLFGKDLTNSGLIMAASAFGSEEMMLGANLMGGDDVVDTHQNFADKVGMSRDEAKQIQHGLLHGMSLFGLVKMLPQYTEQDLENYIVQVYGPSVLNIAKIAAFGKMAVDNKSTQLTWQTLDGYRASHVALFEGVSSQLCTFSTKVKGGYRKEYVTSKMPMHFVGNRPLYKTGDNANQPGWTKKGVVCKLNGLYANITHGLDGWVLRQVVEKVMAKGGVMLMKHDDYIVDPSLFDDIIETVETSLIKINEDKPYDSAMSQIKQASGGRLKSSPAMVHGGAAIEVGRSVNFLMP